MPPWRCHCLCSGVDGLCDCLCVCFVRMFELVLLCKCRWIYVYSLYADVVLMFKMLRRFCGVCEFYAFLTLYFLCMWVFYYYYYSVYLLVYVSFYLIVLHLSTKLPVYSFIHLSIYHSIIYICICLFISISLSISLFIYVAFILHIFFFLSTLLHFIS